MSCQYCMKSIIIWVSTSCGWEAKKMTQKVWYNNRVIKIAIPKKPESLMRSFRDNTVCVYDSG